MLSSRSKLGSLAASLHVNSPCVKTSSCRWKHTVRVILVDDLAGGKGYAGEVHSVSAGFARNYLIPGKKALYATPANFRRVGLVDPVLDPAGSIQRPPEEDDQYAKAADFLRYYLRNKVLKLWRNVDTSTSSKAASSGMILMATHPGMVDAAAVRQKLSTQLKIDLDEDEWVQLSPSPVSHDLVDGTTAQGQEMMGQLLTTLFETTDSTSITPKPNVQIRQLGEYLAKIHLKGQQSVGLRFSVLKR